MSKWSLLTGRGLLVALLGIPPGATLALELDGSTPILCAVVGVTECDHQGTCEPVEPSALGIPPFVRVNVGKKALELTDGSGRKTEIHSVSKENGRLLLQGGENGRGWSLVIGQKAGEMTAAIADHDGGFMVSGDCTLP